MSARCIGPCGRDCNAGQGRNRCARCPGRPFALPAALRPFGNRTLATLIVAVLAALALTACGGGDPEDFDAEGNPTAPAEARKTIQPPNCGASGVCT